MSATQERRERNWPRLTPKQREILLDFEKSKDGTKSIFGPRSGNALERLAVEGLIKFVTGCGYGEFYSITQRGRDYLRFGIRKRSVRP